MKYFINEVMDDPKWIKSAGSKARLDIENILLNEGFTELNYQVPNNKNRIVNRFLVEKRWRNMFSSFTNGDVVLIQYPLIQMSYTVSEVISMMSKKGVNIVLLIHDSNILRDSKFDGISFFKKKRICYGELAIFNSVSKIICHNEKMKKALIKLGVKEEKLVCLEIFDYLLGEYPNVNSDMSSRALLVAGALYPEKCPYIYSVPESVKFNFFGVGYDTSRQKSANTQYFGSFLPDELPYSLEGGFGLIWDGDSIQTCNGTFGEYLKVNNPHKTSLYLASGLPVFIWEKAALADFITKHNCGFAIEKLSDIEKIINSLDDSHYREMKSAVEKISSQLRSGYYFKKALLECL